MVKEDANGRCVLCGHPLPKGDAMFSTLTPVEAKIVSILIHADPGRYLGSEEISNQVYSDRNGKPAWANKSVTVHVSRIRRKLGREQIESLTKGVHGSGYRWAAVSKQLELQLTASSARA